MTQSSMNDLPDDVRPLSPVQMAALTTTALVVFASCSLTLNSQADYYVSPWESPSPSPCGPPSHTPTGGIAPANRAPGGGRLHVVEQGFTQIGGPHGSDVSLGAVLENTSGNVAYRSWVTFRVSDNANQPAEYRAHRRGLVLMVPVLMPGDRIGVGTHASVRESTRTIHGREHPGDPVTVTALDVRLTETQWLQPERNTFARVTTRHERTDQFVIESGYCRPISLHGYAIVFRDQAGTVVGGDFDGEMSDYGSPCQAGPESRSARAYDVLPPNADQTKTEIYPYCDPFPIGDTPDLGPRAADAPWNYQADN